MNLSSMGMSGKGASSTLSPLAPGLTLSTRSTWAERLTPPFFYNDQTGVLYRNGFYELIEVVAR